MAEEIVEAVVELAGEVLAGGVSEASRGKPGCRWRTVFLAFVIIGVVVVGTYWLFG
ncbi:hypothetical protein [Rhizobium sp. MHM7A]|uniref:hypothetical protein n=1 Tax=Rhizobium sp. MHM7A TaxID=2583233 RepID=UPI001486A40B|nr:hypothetical protein [Rhizobium sp. MHM7A]